MKKKMFYLMLTEIHNEVGDYSCGCMGHGYTVENVERDDTHESDYNNPRKVVDGRIYPTYSPSKETLDYLGNILRRYINVE